MLSSLEELNAIQLQHMTAQQLWEELSLVEKVQWFKDADSLQGLRLRLVLGELHLRGELISQ